MSVRRLRNEGKQVILHRGLIDSSVGGRRQKTTANGSSSIRQQRSPRIVRFAGALYENTFRTSIRMYAHHRISLGGSRGDGINSITEFSTMMLEHNHRSPTTKAQPQGHTTGRSLTGSHRSWRSRWVRLSSLMLFCIACCTAWSPPCLVPCSQSVCGTHFW